MRYQICRWGEDCAEDVSAAGGARDDSAELETYGDQDEVRTGKYGIGAWEGGIRGIVLALSNHEKVRCFFLRCSSRCCGMKLTSSMFSSPYAPIYLALPSSVAP
jgi:hypothetical protein